VEVMVKVPVAVANGVPGSVVAVRVTVEVTVGVSAEPPAGVAGKLIGLEQPISYAIISRTDTAVHWAKDLNRIVNTPKNKTVVSI
jgi:hypothetical protein